MYVCEYVCLCMYITDILLCMKMKPEVLRLTWQTTVDLSIHF